MENFIFCALLPAAIEYESVTEIKWKKTWAIISSKFYLWRILISADVL